MSTNATAKSMAVVYLIEPPQSVASQLRTLTPEGTAINAVVAMKNSCSASGRPVVNIWWAKTMKPKTPMAAIENAMARQPKIGFRLKTGMTSETMPNAGTIMM